MVRGESTRAGFLIWWALLAASAANAQGTVAGATPAEFAVAPSGAATYRVPIQVPPGPAGMQPNVALAYDSGTSNGLVGVGWSIQGIGAVSRCPLTRATDGVPKPVNYDVHDRFCLDGARMILVSGAHYGAAGSEYRTELESFSRITAAGAAGVGPASFLVQTKGGLAMEYGVTHDARVEAAGKATVRLWGLNKVSDARGNAMVFSYHDDSSIGVTYPTTIAYGGARIVFEYEARPDNLAAYAVDSAVRTNVRLKAVKTYADQRPVKEYRLAYDRSPSSGKSRLLSITECNPEAAQCLHPLVFDYTSPVIASVGYAPGGHGTGADGTRLVDLFGDGRKVYWTRTGHTHFATRLDPTGNSVSWGWQGHSGGADGWDFADLFGDGRQIYWTRTGHSHFGTRLNADGTVQNWVWQGHSDGGEGRRLIDLFGDGRQVYWTRGGYTHSATRLNPDGTSNNWTWQGHSGGADGWDFADLFGDGRPLYWTRTGSTHYATRLNPDGTVENWSWQGHGTNPGGWRLVDLFGDGRQVYWARGGVDGTFHYATRFNPDGTWQSWEWRGHGGGADGWDFADLFGDGRQVYWTRNGPTHYATRLNPDGTVENWTWQGHGTSAGGWRLVDIFGDGRQVYWARGGADGMAHYVTRLNPDGTAQHWDWHGHGGGTDGWDFADLYGDGRQVYWTRTGGTHYTSSFVRGTQDLLSAVRSDGMAQPRLTIEYTPLSLANNDTYIKGTGAAHPLADLTLPIPVVSSVTAADGVGGTGTTRYQYGGLRAELGTGRGLLGFRWSKATDLRTGLETYSEYRQDWPFTGLLAKKESRLPGAGSSGLVKRTTTTYAQTAGTVGASRFTYASASLEESWDLNGTPLPTVSSSSQYLLNPQYGDPTRTTVGTSDGSVKATDLEYWPADTGSGKWILGRLKKATVTSTKP